VRRERWTIFGENLINIREKSIPRLLLDEVGRASRAAGRAPSVVGA